MSNTLLLLAILTPVLLTVGGLATADASHYTNGNVKDGSSGLDNAKITFERAGNYEWARTSASSGYYYEYLPTGTATWSVDAMQDGYDRDTSTGISRTDKGNDFDLSTRNSITASFKVAHDTDTSVSPSEARYQLMRVEPWFFEEHGIEFNDLGASEAWTSNGETSNGSCDIRDELTADIEWLTQNDYEGTDILIGFSDGKITGTASKACMSDGATINTIPTAGGTHPYIYVDISGTSHDMDRRVAHEISHVYGFGHQTTCTDNIPNIMGMTNSARCDEGYIVNWTPADDLTLENRRNWY
jgi:hypothetical protein